MAYGIYLSDSIAAGVLKEDSVTTAKIADDAVAAAELASNAVVNASIASNAAIDIDKIDGGSCANALSDLADGLRSVTHRKRRLCQDRNLLPTIELRDINPFVLVNQRHIGLASRANNLLVSSMTH